MSNLLDNRIFGMSQRYFAGGTAVYAEGGVSSISSLQNNIWHVKYV